MSAPRTPQELRDFVPHLCYEIRMLMMASVCLVREQTDLRRPRDLGDWAVHNALIEALTVHARILTEFFFHGREKPNDAIADDFVPGWHKKRPALPAVLKPLNSRVGKEIVHLSFGRLAHKTDFDKRWPSGEIVDELVQVIDRWADLAPDFVRQEVMAQTREVNDFVASRLAPPDSGSSR